MDRSGSHDLGADIIDIGINAVGVWNFGLNILLMLMCHLKAKRIEMFRSCNRRMS